MNKVNRINSEMKILLNRKKSTEVKHGKIFEQFIPFSDNFPFNVSDFRFIGNPIDGIVFDNDKIIFVEFKLNNSRLSSRQKRIKEIVKNKKVYWYEFRGK